MRTLIPIALLSFVSPVVAKAVTMAGLLEGSIPSPVVYGTNDPAAQVIIPFLPVDGKTAARRPALVLIHGGGWTSGDPSVFYPAARYFASRGMPSFCIGYRLVGPGTNDPSVADCLADCRMAMRYLRTHDQEYGIDPCRIAVLGDSAGGHLAACLGTIADSQPDPEITSGANLMIPCNPILDLGPGDGNTNPWFRLIQKGTAMEKKTNAETIAPTAEKIAEAKSLSPIHFVSSGAAPTLLMHGIDDTVVPFSGSEKFAVKLRKSGVPVELNLIPGARHAFILPRYTATEEQVVEAMEMVDRFLSKNGYLGGDPTLVLSPEPAWTPKNRPAHPPER
jgi:acetyl esterase/lipase